MGLVDASQIDGWGGRCQKNVTAAAGTAIGWRTAEWTVDEKELEWAGPADRTTVTIFLGSLEFEPRYLAEALGRLHTQFLVLIARHKLRRFGQVLSLYHVCPLWKRRQKSQGRLC